MMKDRILDPEHLAFRDLARAFIQAEIVPGYREWEAAGAVPREVWRAAGKAGLLGTEVPAEYGGGGVADPRFPLILAEEIAAASVSGVGFALLNDVVLPYLDHHGTTEQKQRWLPGLCAGETLPALAVTEPSGGSDLRSLRAAATATAAGFLLNATKSFVSNGRDADLVIVAAITHPERRERDGGISLLIVERGMPGWQRGPAADTIGLTAQGVCDLFFTDVAVPADHLLGRAGRGLTLLGANLSRERLSIACAALAGAEAVFAETLAFCRDRTVGGVPVGSYQHNRFVLAEMATELDVARAYVDQCVLDAATGTAGLDPVTAAKAKWWTTDLQSRVVDRCLQLHGGAGYTRDTRVGRAYTDARVMPIYGGTNEVMKELIGRTLGV
jgi:alkylation response protein AidB-like acyl-CoA dehydrogenase